MGKQASSQDVDGDFSIQQRRNVDSGRIYNTRLEPDVFCLHQLIEILFTGTFFTLILVLK